MLSVGDGIARVAAGKRTAGEMVEFPRGEGMALGLERDNVGVVIFGEDRGIKEGDTVKRLGESLTCRSARVFWAASSIRWASRSTARGPIQAAERRTVDVKAPASFRARAHEPMQTGIRRSTR